MLTKEEYLKCYPYQVVKISTRPNDCYEVSCHCGGAVECANFCANALAIFHDDKYITFKIRPNQY